MLDCSQTPLSDPSMGRFCEYCLDDNFPVNGDRGKVISKYNELKERLVSNHPGAQRPVKPSSSDYDMNSSVGVGKYAVALAQYEGAKESHKEDESDYKRKLRILKANLKNVLLKDAGFFEYVPKEYQQGALSFIEREYYSWYDFHDNAVELVEVFVIPQKP